MFFPLVHLFFLKPSHQERIAIQMERKRYYSKNNSNNFLSYFNALQLEEDMTTRIITRTHYKQRLDYILVLKVYSCVIRSYQPKRNAFFYYPLALKVLLFLPKFKNVKILTFALMNLKVIHAKIIRYAKQYSTIFVDDVSKLMNYRGQ